jgi:hypothetical protein
VGLKAIRLSPATMGICSCKIEPCIKEIEDLCAAQEEILQQGSASRCAEIPVVASRGFVEAVPGPRRAVGRASSIPGHVAAGYHSRSREPQSPSGTTSLTPPRRPPDSPSAKERALGGRDRQLPCREPRRRIRPLRPSLASLRGGGGGRSGTETGRERGRGGGHRVAKEAGSTVTTRPGKYRTIA